MLCRSRIANKMSKFRLAVSLKTQQEKVDRFTRPELPDWLHPDRRQEYMKRNPKKNNMKMSHTYWSKIYYATPPWLNTEQCKEMKRIHDSCPDRHNVDHIVPLSNPLVCGLHVPWNLQHLTFKQNMNKSNKWWPDHPFETKDLFND